MTDSHAPKAADDNALIAERREKLAAIRRQGVAFPNDFKPRDRAAELVRKHGGLANEELEPLGVAVSVAGRLMLKRIMGKASFGTLQDATGRIQLFVTRDALGDQGVVVGRLRRMGVGHRAEWSAGGILGGCLWGEPECASPPVNSPIAQRRRKRMPLSFGRAGRLARSAAFSSSPFLSVNHRTPALVPALIGSQDRPGAWPLVG
jgi:hypothetical protein